MYMYISFCPLLVIDLYSSKLESVGVMKLMKSDFFLFVCLVFFYQENQILDSDYQLFATSHLPPSRSTGHGIGVQVQDELSENNTPHEVLLSLLLRK